MNSCWRGEKDNIWTNLKSSFLQSNLKSLPEAKRNYEKFISYPDRQLKELQSLLVEAKRLKIDYLIIFNLQREISDDAKQLVRSNLLPPWCPKIIPMVLKHVEAVLEDSYSEQKIKNFVKNEMKYSYKKGSSRPPVYATIRTQLAKVLFWTELLTFIGKGETIINLDESSFDRSTKLEFSWLPKGRSCQFINDWLKGRTSLILATWNTSEWFAMVVLDTVNSQKFWFFLKLLEAIVRSRNCITQKSPIVIFDNARTHSSIFTKV